MKTATTFVKHIAGLVFQAALWISVVCGFAWAVGSVYFLTYLPRRIAPVLAVAFAGAAFCWARKSPARQTRRQRLAACIVAAWVATMPQQPSNQRDWAEDNLQLAHVQTDGDQVTIVNFRNNVYRSESDFDVNFENLEFDISRIRRVWFVVQRFTTMEGIAHNFLTFEYTRDSKLAYFSVSVEIRREKEESFSPVRGLYRQYELIYVVSSEQDEIGMRTVLRPEDRVFMYEVNANAGQVQQLFTDIADRINSLEDSPEFYHSLLNNCTNNIVTHTYKLTAEPINWLDPRIVAPGYADRFAFAHGLVGKDTESFDALQARCRIDEIARSVGIGPDFSAQIRRDGKR